MKLLTALSIALLFVLVIGCDGDGDGGTTTTTEGTEPGEGTQGPVTIVTGSETINYSDYGAFVFDIFETGVIEARVEWSSGPPKLSIGLYHSNTATGVNQSSIQSPAILQTQATQDLLDNDNQWVLNVGNPSPSEDMTVNYTVTFTPD